MGRLWGRFDARKLFARSSRDGRDARVPYKDIEAGKSDLADYLRGPLPGQSLVFFFGRGLEESPDTTEQCAL